MAKLPLNARYSGWRGCWEVDSVEDAVGGRPYSPGMGPDPCVCMCLHTHCVDMSVPALLSPHRSLYRYLGVSPVCV